MSQKYVKEDKISLAAGLSSYHSCYIIVMFNSSTEVFQTTHVSNIHVLNLCLVCGHFFLRSANMSFYINNGVYGKTQCTATLAKLVYVFIYLYNKC